MKQHEGKFAAVYNFGDTTVYIDNSYVAKTPEEREQIIKEIQMEGVLILREETKKRLKAHSK